jgi:hypothetical protein
VSGFAIWRVLTTYRKTSALMKAVKLSILVHKYANVFFYAARRYESACLLFILNMSRLRSLRVNFHSKGFAIPS